MNIAVKDNAARLAEQDELLKKQAAALTVAKVAQWLDDRIGDDCFGDFLTRDMARYALTDPDEMRAEIAEEMDEGESELAKALPEAPEHAHLADPVELNAQAKALTQKKVAAWLEDQIGDGLIGFEAVPTLMARYALSHPSVVRMDIWQQMNETSADRPRPRG
jgi:hypothetical protein